MNLNSKPSAERLYLQQDDNDEIYVDSILHQHHIDGIRFLYKQFKKKKLGVIINNPLGYGNSLQVALFLGAIRHILDKPILILCEQSEELNWLEHFQKLTQCYNVGVGAPSPFVKKSIFINTMERLELFCRRDWSVVVVDNDAFLKEKSLQAKFKADFKIWITPVNMKDNLETFASIHKWIFPKNKLNIGDFLAKPGDRIDAISKAILLEAFLEDIVCRTTLQTPFENPFDKCEGTPRKASKKNKDATGTKIKRSKKSSDTANTSTNAENSDQDAGASAAKVPRTETTSADDFTISNFSRNEDVKKSGNNKDTESDIESFIRQEEPIKFDPFNEFDNISRNSHESRTEFIDDEAVFNTADRLNKLLESNMPMDIVENPECCFIDSDTNSDSLLPLAKAVNESSRGSIDSDFGEPKRTTPDYLTDNILNEIKEDIFESHNSDTFKDNFNHEDCKVEEKPVEVIKEDLDVEDTNEVQKRKDEEEMDTDQIKPEMAIDESDELKQEPKKEVIESEVKESPVKQDLDAKFKELDERAFKKFKGSILDSLF